MPLSKVTHRVSCAVVVRLIPVRVRDFRHCPCELQVNGSWRLLSFLEDCQNEDRLLCKYPGVAFKAVRPLTRPGFQLVRRQPAKPSCCTKRKYIVPKTLSHDFASFSSSSSPLSWLALVRLKREVEILPRLPSDSLDVSREQRGRRKHLNEERNVAVASIIAGPPDMNVWGAARQSLGEPPN